MQWPAAPTAGRDSLLGSQPERRRDVLVEVRDRRGVGVGLPAPLALVVEPEHRTRGLEPVVDLGREHTKP